MSRVALKEVWSQKHFERNWRVSFEKCQASSTWKVWKPGWLKDQSKILPLSHEETSASEGNFNVYVLHLSLFTYIRLTATENSIRM